MDPSDNIDHLRLALADFERNSRRTKWLLRQLGKKARTFPKDLSARLQRSLRKRRNKTIIQEILAPESSEQLQEANSKVPARQSSPQNLFFDLHDNLGGAILEILCKEEDAQAALTEMSQFIGSREMVGLVAAAAKIDPEVGSITGKERGIFSHWHNGEYSTFRRILQETSEAKPDSIVLVPFGKLGGADLVSAILAKELTQAGRTLILRTDQSDWDRPDWYPSEAASIDISQELRSFADPPRALYLLLRKLDARQVWNVNSRLAFDMLAQYGERLGYQSKLYSYYFCSDRDSNGIEVGYPIWYFANIFPHLTAAICDSSSLTLTLSQRYNLPNQLSRKLRTVYTPAQTVTVPNSLTDIQESRRNLRARPRILWAGRLDRQKRFDIVIALARDMPDVDFEAWGKAVLDISPDLRDLPRNLRLHEPFTDYSQLPLKDCDGWLYTSEWDGIPTILIELGAMGMPIVASSVGGVPELVDQGTGWPVMPQDGVRGYSTAIRAMLGEPMSRKNRAAELQRRVQSRHNANAFRKAIAELLE